MATLMYQGHASIRLISSGGTVIYVDPFAGGGYDKPADIVMVTHQHGDHNKIDIPVKKRGWTLITEKDALNGGKYNRFSIKGIEIEAVEAYNKNHPKDKGVGYVLSMDGITVYAAGDTSRTRQMEILAAKRLDYALLPCDGVYNMDVDGASKCAQMLKARHSIPIHMKPGALFDKRTAERFVCEGKIMLEPGMEIEL